MVSYRKLYRVIIMVLILTLFACSPTRVTPEVPFSYHNHAHLTDPFSIELVSGEIIPVRFHDLIMAELTDSLYVVYYRQGDKMIFPIREIKSVRFDVIDPGSKRRHTFKIIGAAAGAIYFVVSIVLAFAFIALLIAIINAL